MSERHKPGMKRLRWRWKDSKDVEPLAHLYTGSRKPPFMNAPVSVYRATSGRSWMHLMCFFWTCQMCCILSLSKRGTPRESFPLLPISPCSSSSSSFVVVSSPRVLLRQWRASSSLDRCLLMSSSVRQGRPCDWSGCFLASRNRAKSVASHSNTHIDKRDMKAGYSWWASVVHPRASRRMKCQISSLTVRSGHPLNLTFNLVSTDSAQQPQSTYRMTGGSTPACWYRLTRSAAIMSRPAPSWAVSTLISIWPYSFPTEVSQSAVPLAAPASFLMIWSTQNV